jgi:hypothetical protein
MAGAMLNNPPLRINDLAAFNGNIDWDGGNLNAAGNAQLVNIEGYNRFTTDWHDVWNGGSRKAELRVNGGYVKVALDLGATTFTSISSYDKTHGLYEEDNTGNGNIAAAGTPGVTHDVLVIDMDQEYKQYTQELRRLERRCREAPLIAAPICRKALLAQDIRFSDGFPGAPSANGITPRCST